jgi:hypothetical protein
VHSGISEPDNVIKGFEILSTDLDEAYQEIIEYFVGTYCAVNKVLALFSKIF